MDFFNKKLQELRRERKRKLELLKKLDRFLGASISTPDIIFSLSFLQENFTGSECIFLMGPGGLLMEEEPGSAVFRVSPERSIIWALDIVGPRVVARILEKKRRGENLEGKEQASGF